MNLQCSHFLRGAGIKGVKGQLCIILPLNFHVQFHYLRVAGGIETK